jgi:hypothetical protein
MEQRNPDHAERLPLGRSRKMMIIRHRAVEGEEPGLVEVVLEKRVTGEGLLETETTRYSYCCSCNRAIRESSHVNAVCVVCKGVICPNCSTVTCANERCLKAVCPSCRKTIFGKVYCKPHAIEELIKTFWPITIPIMVIGVVALTLTTLIARRFVR